MLFNPLSWLSDRERASVLLVAGLLQTFLCRVSSWLTGIPRGQECPKQLEALQGRFSQRSPHVSRTSEKAGEVVPGL